MCSFVLWIFWFKVAPQSGCPLTATAAARATKVSVRARAALRSTSFLLPVPRPSQRPIPPQTRSSWGPWAGGPTSRRWTVLCLKDLPTWCSKQRCVARQTCSALEPSASATGRRPRGKPTRRRWLRSRSWKNASRTSAGSGFPIAFLRGRTCGNRSCWENTISKKKKKRKRKSKITKIMSCTKKWTTTSGTHCVLGQKWKNYNEKKKAGHFSSRHD